MNEQIKAEVRQIPSESSPAGVFQTFDLLIPPGRHWQMDNAHRGASVTIYCPTDDELRAIVVAARGEIKRRHELAHPRPCADCDSSDPVAHAAAASPIYATEEAR